LNEANNHGFISVKRPSGCPHNGALFFARPFLKVGWLNISFDTLRPALSPCTKLRNELASQSMNKPTVIAI
jgi:hypothetical protein